MLIQIERTQDHTQIPSIVVNKSKEAILELSDIIEAVGGLYRESEDGREFVNCFTTLKTHLECLHQKAPTLDTTNGVFRMSFLSEVQAVALKIEEIFRKLDNGAFYNNSAGEKVVAGALITLENILVGKGIQYYQPGISLKEIDAATPKNFLEKLIEYRNAYGERKVTCYLSYSDFQTELANELKTHLEIAGVTVHINASEHRLNEPQDKIFKDILKCDYAIILGDRRYGQIANGSAETNLKKEIGCICNKQSHRILRILVDGNRLKSFPLSIANDGYPIANITNADSYFITCEEVLNVMYWVKVNENTLASEKKYLTTNLEQLKTRLKEKYVDYQYLTRFTDMKQKTSIEDTFINLSIICETKSRTGEYEVEMCPPKTGDTLDKLFPADGESITSQHVVIEGRAGVGKTTMCHYISFFSTQNSMEREKKLGPWIRRFELVIYVPLRNLLSKQKPILNLSQFLSEEYFENFRGQDIEELLNENRNKILYIIDGYDEIAHRASNFATLLNHFEKQPYCLYTTRPNYLTSHRCGTRYFEIAGFSDEAIEDYVAKFFKACKKTELIESIHKCFEKEPIIYALAHTPINLELFCIYWVSRVEHDSASLNLTDLYTNLVLKLIHRFHDKSGANHDEIKTLKCVEGHRKYGDYLRCLAEMAWKMLESKEVIATGSACNEILIKYSHSIPLINGDELFRKLGFLISTGPFTKWQECQYYFAHYTFQQYLAARYLAHMFENSSSREQAKKLIARNKFYSQFEITLIFTSGILSSNNEILQEFICVILDEPKSILGIHEICLAIRCFEELAKPDKLKNYHETITKFVSILERQLTLSLPLTRSLTLLTLRRSPKIFMNSKIQSALCTQLNQKPLETAYSIAAIGTPSKEICNKLVELLSQKEYRLCATIALQQINPKDTNIIMDILGLIENPDHDIGNAAEKILMASQVHDARIIDKIAILLGSNVCAVRARAARILSTVNCDLKTCEQLASLIMDKDNSVSINAANALAFSKPNDENIITKLLDIIKSSSNDIVKSRAVTLFGIIKPQNRHVNSLLVILLEHKNSELSSRATVALELIAPNDSDIVNDLRRLLNHQKATVRQTIIRILSTIQPENSDLYREFIRVLHKSETREEASRALITMRPADKGVYTELKHLCDNTDKDISSYSLTIYYKLFTPNKIAIPKIIRLLIYPNKYIRARASDILRSLDKFSITEIDEIKKQQQTCQNLSIKKEIEGLLDIINPKKQFINSFRTDPLNPENHTNSNLPIIDPNIALMHVAQLLGKNDEISKATEALKAVKIVDPFIVEYLYTLAVGKNSACQRHAISLIQLLDIELLAKLWNLFDQKTFEDLLRLHILNKETLLFISESSEGNTLYYEKNKTIHQFPLCSTNSHTSVDICNEFTIQAYAELLKAEKTKKTAVKQIHKIMKHDRESVVKFLNILTSLYAKLIKDNVLRIILYSGCYELQDSYKLFFNLMYLFDKSISGDTIKLVEKIFCKILIKNILEYRDNINNQREKSYNFLNLVDNQKNHPLVFNSYNRTLHKNDKYIQMVSITHLLKCRTEKNHIYIKKLLEILSKSTYSEIRNFLDEIIKVEDSLLTILNILEKECSERVIQDVLPKFKSLRFRRLLVDTNFIQTHPKTRSLAKKILINRGANLRTFEQLRIMRVIPLTHLKRTVSDQCTIKLINNKFYEAFKEHYLTNLDHYNENFEKNITKFEVLASTLTLNLFFITSLLVINELLNKLEIDNYNAGLFMFNPCTNTYKISAKFLLFSLVSITVFSSIIFLYNKEAQSANSAFSDMMEENIFILVNRHDLYPEKQEDILKKFLSNLNSTNMPTFKFDKSIAREIILRYYFIHQINVIKARISKQLKSLHLKK